MHTVLANKNKIYVSGYNHYGQLGLGHNENQTSPQLLTLEPEVSQTLSLKGRLDWKLTLPSPIACGRYHTIILKVNLVPEGAGGTRSCAPKSYHDVLVFGANTYGQLGLGHNENQNKPQLLMQGEEIHQIACGIYHTILLGASLVPEWQVGLEARASKSCHDVLVFGDNQCGQLGLGHNKTQNEPQLLLVQATLLSGILTYSEWSPEYHSVFSPHFQAGIYTFLLVHKHLSLHTGVKIPKFVLFEIFKRVY
jgi:alpha-tubulin suppressor-like RCC1 family protein